MDSESDNSYGGSLMFAGLAAHLDLSVDQANYIVSQLVALCLATLYRTVLHPSKTTPEVRHAFGLMFGLLIGYFCFGLQAIHLAVLPAVSYAIIVSQNPHVMHGMVLTVALIYLSCIHLHRQIYHYGSYGLDISGPLMVITQKVTSLAFNLHDGLTKTEDDLTTNQKTHAVRKTPNPLEFFSYTLLFPSIMAGPMIFYNDYIEFIEGKNYYSSTHQCRAKQNSVVVIEPSPVRAVVKKVLSAIVCAVIFVKFLPIFPISRAKDENFLENTSVSYKFWYLTVCTALVRFKYYFAWTIADAVCNNCGLGFSGYNDDGTANWNKFSNVDIFQFEFGTSLKQSIEAWNKGTNLWLRMMVYERTRKYSTVLTFALSAIWHGFYPGYYITFFGGALFTYAARVMRRTVRNYFIRTNETKLLYDVLTFMVTRFVMAYITFSFILLEFWPSIEVYNKLFWVCHILGVLALIIVPKVIPISTPSEISQKSGIALALRQAGSYSNTVGHTQ